VSKYIHEATTIQIGSIFPFVASKPLGIDKILIGRDLLGGLFLHDPFELYKAGVITSPNMVIVGQIGRGKSSLVKTYLYRQAAFGRQVVVLDPKGEYGPLATCLGAEPIYLYPGGPYRLNPLDMMSAESRSASEDRAGGERHLFKRRLELLTAISAACVQRNLKPIEYTALEYALTAASGRHTTVLLGHIIEELLYPFADSYNQIGVGHEELTLGARDVALELRRLVYGELAGMFDGATSPELKLNRKVFVLDLSALYSSPALGIMMACATSFIQSIYTGITKGKTLLVVDEAWAVLQNAGVARFLQASWKLARSRGIANIAVLHRISDLETSGEDSSVQNKISTGLLSDSETVICYAQPHQELSLAAKSLGITNEEAALLPTLRKGVGLWKVGSRTYLVEHKLTSAEKAIIDTDQSLIG
jgi:type IV secretory pathway VirB4 component